MLAVVDGSDRRGALSSAASDNLAHAATTAARVRLPFVAVIASSGADIIEGMSALHGWGTAAKAMAECSGIVPTILVVDGPAVSGPALLLGLADHVVIIDHGRVIATGTPSELKSRAGRDMIEVRVRNSDQLDATVAVLAGLGTEAPTVDVPARRASVPVVDGPASLSDAVRIIGERGIVLDDLGLRQPTLDEVFLALTGAPQ